MLYPQSSELAVLHFNLEENFFNSYNPTELKFPSVGLTNFLCSQTNSSNSVVQLLASYLMFLNSSFFLSKMEMEIPQKVDLKTEYDTCTTVHGTWWTLKNVFMPLKGHFPTGYNSTVEC